MQKHTTTIIFLAILVMILGSCKKYSYDPKKTQEFIPIKRMEKFNKEEGSVHQTILVKNAPVDIEDRKKMIQQYARGQVSQFDSIYNDYGIDFYHYGDETSQYLKQDYREDWEGNRYLLYSGDATWSDIRFKIGFLFSKKSEKDTNLLDIYLDVSTQEFPEECYTIGTSKRFKIAEGITHIKELPYIW